MQIPPQQLIKGLASFIPGVHSTFARSCSGGTNSARYCYSVWLRHLVMAYENGLSTNPRAVAELGPGDSIGTGLAALISGAELYYALDVVEYANIEQNIEVFDQLVELFRKREDIPAEEEFPEVRPRLGSYRFPHQVLTEENLRHSLDAKRLDGIRQAVAKAGSKDSCIRYQVPLYNTSVIEDDSIDEVFSQAVLEHVDDLPLVYDLMYRWLKLGGFMSHTIDFDCHHTSRDWNGHWTYSDSTWKLIRGRRPYFINRKPYSRHRELMESLRFSLVTERLYYRPSNLGQADLAPSFRGIDPTICGAFIQAVK